MLVKNSTRHSPPRAEWARNLLAREGGESAENCAAGAGRILDTLRAHLVPLIGTAGVDALLLRSAKLVKGEFAWLEESEAIQSSAALRECLRTREAGAAREAAAALFGTFFTLLITFIGERLTAEILQAAWPSLDAEAVPQRKD